MDDPRTLHGVTLTFVHAALWHVEIDNDRKSVTYKGTSRPAAMALILEWLALNHLDGVSSRVEGCCVVVADSYDDPVAPGLGVPGLAWLLSLRLA